MGPRAGDDPVTPHTRPPADDDADHVLVRTAECIDGQVEVELVCEPVFDYGREGATWALVGDDRHEAHAQGAGTTLSLRADLPLGVEGGRVRARHVLRAGERAFCALSWDADLAGPADVDEAAARLASTTRFWRDWLRRARAIDHPYRQAIERSALTIKGLTYMPTGATVAALTTSLPEAPGGERNWTTASPGCATRPSRSRPSTTWTSTGRPTSSSSSSATSNRWTTAGARSCTASTAAATSRRRPAQTSSATRGRGRGGSGTTPRPSGRTPSTAPRSTPSCCTPAAPGACPGPCGRSSSSCRAARRRSGRSPTRASGRPAAPPATTCRPSSCAGWRSTGRPSSPP